MYLLEVSCPIEWLSWPKGHVPARVILSASDCNGHLFRVLWNPTDQPLPGSRGTQRSVREPQDKRKPKTFETQRNRGSGGQKEETEIGTLKNKNQIYPSGKAGRNSREESRENKSLTRKVAAVREPQAKINIHHGDTEKINFNIFTAGHGGKGGGHREDS